MLLKVSLLNFFPLDTYFSVIFLQNCYCEIPSFYTEEQSNHFKKIICYSRKKKSFIFVHSATEVLKSSPCTFVRTDLSHSCSKDQDEIVGNKPVPCLKKDLRTWITFLRSYKDAFLLPQQPSALPLYRAFLTFQISFY